MTAFLGLVSLPWGTGEVYNPGRNKLVAPPLAERPEPVEEVVSASPPPAPRRRERAPADDADDEGRQPCPACGEMIPEAAAKCRYCGEIFDPGLRKLERKRRGKSSDANLTGVEVLLAILCSAIGCIVGIVYVTQGKPKGAKMVGLSLLFVVIWNVVRFAVEAALQR